ncbi:MAG: hypothetical protein ACK439_15155, partial [Novosphingobium sp.]
MILNRRTAIASLAALPFGGRALASQTPVTVFEARRIVTMEPALPTARFVAVADGIILGLGQTLEELAPWTSGRTTRIDRSLAGQVLSPGLIDPHVHPMLAAVMLNLPFIAPDDWDLPNGRYPGARTPRDWWDRLRATL